MLAKNLSNESKHWCFCCLQDKKWIKIANSLQLLWFFDELFDVINDDPFLMLPVWKPEKSTESFLDKNTATTLLNNVLGQCNLGFPLLHLYDCQRELCMRDEQLMMVMNISIALSLYIKESSRATIWKSRILE